MSSTRRHRRRRPPTRSKQLDTPCAIASRHLAHLIMWGRLRRIVVHDAAREGAAGACAFAPPAAAAIGGMIVVCSAWGRHAPSAPICARARTIEYGGYRCSVGLGLSVEARAPIVLCVPGRPCESESRAARETGGVV